MVAELAELFELVVRIPRVCFLGSALVCVCMRVWTDWNDFITLAAASVFACLRVCECVGVCM